MTNGIIAMGLGGDPSSLILGGSILSLEITVEDLAPPPPPPPPPYSSSGGGGHSGGFAAQPTRSFNSTIPDVRTIKIVLKHKDKTWTKTYITNINKANIVITIVNTINTVISSVAIGISQVKSAINKIRVKRNE